jgi:hypothetical protein
MIVLAVSQDVQFQFLSTREHDLSLLLCQRHIWSRPLVSDLGTKISQ